MKTLTQAISDALHDIELNLEETYVGHYWKSIDSLARVNIINKWSEILHEHMREAGEPQPTPLFTRTVYSIEEVQRGIPRLLGVWRANGR